MLRDNNLRYHAIQLIEQLRYLDEKEQLDSLDEIIDALSKRRESLRFTAKNNDRIEVKYIGGYYRVYKNGELQKTWFATERDAYESYSED